MKNNTYKLERDKFSVPIDLPPQYHAHSHTNAACRHDSHRLYAIGQIAHRLKQKKNLTLFIYSVESQTNSVDWNSIQIFEIEHDLKLQFNANVFLIGTFWDKKMLQRNDWSIRALYKVFSFGFFHL